MNQIILARTIYYSIEIPKWIIILFYLIGSGAWINLKFLKGFYTGETPFEALTVVFITFISIPSVIHINYNYNLNIIISFILCGYIGQFSFLILIRLYNLVEWAYDTIDKQRNL